MIKIRVTLNWNHPKGKVQILKVPESWNKNQITKALLRKFGKIDFEKWEYIDEQE